MNDHSSPAFNIVPQRVETGSNHFLIVSNHGDGHGRVASIFQVSDLGDTELKARTDPLSNLCDGLPLVFEASRTGYDELEPEQPDPD